MHKITNDSNVYTDIQSLEHIKSKISSDPNLANEEVAKQFESIFVSLVLKSMRQANESFDSGLFSSQHMEIYQDLFDKQLSMNIANHGIGFSKMISDHLNAKNNLNHHPVNIPTNINTVQSKNGNPISESEHIEKIQLIQNKSSDNINQKSDFIHQLWSQAKSSAKVIGVSPAILIAQSALETQWGQKILKKQTGESTFNLFNIKANSSWNKGTTLISALEQDGEIIKKQKSIFKAYHSFKESFDDYVDLIKNSSLYKDVTSNLQSDSDYIKNLQLSGYATDSRYAEKVMSIYHNSEFQNIINSLT